MTSQRQLDRLMQLRRQRTRLAEEALAAEQRNCREFEAHCQTLGQTLEHHQYQAVQREQALFEQGDRHPSELPADALSNTLPEPHPSWMTALQNAWLERYGVN